MPESDNELRGCSGILQRIKIDQMTGPEALVGVSADLAESRIII